MKIDKINKSNVDQDSSTNIPKLFASRTFKNQTPSNSQLLNPSDLVINQKYSQSKQIITTPTTQNSIGSQIFSRVELSEKVNLFLNFRREKLRDRK